MTYYKESERNKLSISLRDLGINEYSKYPASFPRMDSLFTRIVVYSPTRQSHLGKKFDQYHGINNKTVNDFLQKVFSGLGVSHVYVYQSFEEKKHHSRTDLRSVVVNDNGTMICLRCDNGVKESLYMAIRNAVAHGNIVTDELNRYILYSVSDDKNEYDSPITLFLRIKNIRKLQSLFSVLDLYS